ncbi:MAG: alpha/beta fold hydrolase [Planctomycetaceae bacterium]
MSLVPIADLHLNVTIEGSGSPLLLVHGFPLDHTMWRAQIAEFAKNQTVIAPDLRGFGRSEATTGTVEMARFADDLAEMLDELSVDEPVTFCGLSMGGYIAFEFLQRHPRRVRQLILCDTRAAADTSDAAARRHATADRVLAEGPGFLADTMPDKLYSESTRRDQPELIAATQKVIRQSSRIGVAAASRGMALRRDANPQLAQIAVPTLVVVGEEDVISPPDEMREWCGKIPGGQFVSLPGAGHMSPEEQPEQFNKVAGKFLQG